MRRIAFAGGVALALACAGVALAAARGDRHAIAIERASRRAIAAYQGIAFTGRGTSYEIVPLRGGADSFRFDFGATPTGYRAAVASVLIVARHGVVQEEVDTLRAAGLPALRLWQGAAVEVGEVLGAKRCPMLVPHNTAAFSTPGQPFVAVNGTFAKPQRRAGGTTLVHSSYPLGGGVAHETDTIASARHLWTGSRVVVVGGPYNGSSLSESRFAYARSQRLRQPPRLRRCG